MRCVLILLSQTPQAFSLPSSEDAGFTDAYRGFGEEIRDNVLSMLCVRGQASSSMRGYTDRLILRAGLLNDDETSSLDESRIGGFADLRRIAAHV
jgi:hypothetical protein